MGKKICCFIKSVNGILVLIKKKISKISENTEPSKKKRNNFFSLKLIIKNENNISIPIYADGTCAQRKPIKIKIGISVASIFDFLR